MNRRITVLPIFLYALLGAMAPPTAYSDSSDYKIKAADLLLVSVWKEEDLQLETIVRPDGKFSFPLAGEIRAQGRTISEVQESVTEAIKQYIPDPVVTVILRQSLGNRVFVLGQVNRPGEFPLSQDMDVLQALALGGGLATFADRKDIKILRRTENGQSSIPFNYKSAINGSDLGQNILLEPGDIVVVP